MTRLYKLLNQEQIEAVHRCREDLSQEESRRLLQKKVDHFKVWARELLARNPEDLDMVIEASLKFDGYIMEFSTWWMSFRDKVPYIASIDGKVMVRHLNLAYRGKVDGLSCLPRTIDWRFKAHHLDRLMW